MFWCVFLLSDNGNDFFLPCFVVVCVVWVMVTLWRLERLSIVGVALEWLSIVEVAIDSSERG